MARSELAPEILDDFDRFFDHLTRFEVADPAARIDEIVQAIRGQREAGYQHKT